MQKFIVSAFTREPTERRFAPESAAFAGQAEYLLADPEMKALLAGSPR